MAETNKVLAQVKPGAASLTDAYTVPASTSTVVSSIVVCNQSATATSFSITVAPAGAADDPKHYLYSAVPIPGNDTFVATIGVTLATTDKIRVLNTLATCSFNLFGVEIT